MGGPGFEVIFLKFFGISKADTKVWDVRKMMPVDSRHRFTEIFNL